MEQCIWMQLPFWCRIIGKLCQNVNVQCESVLLFFLFFLHAMHQLSFPWRLDFNVVNRNYIPCKWRVDNCDRSLLSAFGWGTTTTTTNIKIRNYPGNNSQLTCLSWDKHWHQRFKMKYKQETSSAGHFPNSALESNWFRLLTSAAC